MKQQNVTLKQEQEQIQQEMISFQKLSKQKELEQKELEQKTFFINNKNKKAVCFTKLTENREQKKQQIAVLEQEQKQMIENISLLSNEIFRIETKQEKITEENKGFLMKYGKNMK